MSLILTILIGALAVSGLFFTLLGALTVFYWIKPGDPPTDRSNVINRIRLWWFSLTRRALFVPVCPWLLNDELENVRPK